MLGKIKIFIIGAGDKGTAAAMRLFRSGFRPLLAERNNPTDLHFFRNFSDVVYLGEKTIDDVRCVLINESNETRIFTNQINLIRKDRKVPVIKGEVGLNLALYKPDIIIDSRSDTASTDDWNWSDYPCVIRIGPGFKVGRDAHFVIGAANNELGRVYRIPVDLTCEVQPSHFLSHAPLEGVFISHRDVGDTVAEREEVGSINDIPILAPRKGVITGLLHSGHFVASKQPLFEIMPKTTGLNVNKQSPFRCLAIAGGILEAILTFISENRSN